MSAARARIAGGALEVFSRYGYAAATMRQVADQLGIQAPSLYSHVTGKAALLELVLTPLLDDLDRQFGAVPIGAVPVGAGPDRDRQRGWLLGYRKLLDTHQGAVRLVAGDLTVNRHSQLAGRISAQQVLLSTILISFGAADAAHASAVAGMLTWPVLWLPAPARGTPQHAVDQAVAVLALPAGGPSLPVEFHR